MQLLRDTIFQRGNTRPGTDLKELVGVSVEVRRRLVKHENACAGQQRTRQGKELSLTDGKSLATVLNL